MTGNDYREALRELSISLVISTMPVWLGMLIIWSRSSNVDIWSVIQHGELFMYASAVVAPVLYIVARDRYSNRSGFPGKVSFMIAVIVVAMTSAGFYTMNLIEAQNFPRKVIILSAIIFFISVCVNYLALVFNNTFTPNPTAEMQAQEDNFNEKFMEHRRKLEADSE